MPVVEPADLGTGAFVHGDDPGGGGSVQRGEPGFGTLSVGQQVARGGADQVVSVADQRSLFVGETGRRRQLRRPAVRRPVDASAECTSTRAR